MRHELGLVVEIHERDLRSQTTSLPHAIELGIPCHYAWGDRAIHDRDFPLVHDEVFRVLEFDRLTFLTFDVVPDKVKLLEGVLLPLQLVHICAHERLHLFDVFLVDDDDVLVAERRCEHAGL